VTGYGLSPIHAIAFVAACAALSPLAAQAPRTDVQVVTLTEARERALLASPAAIEARSRIETSAWERRTALTDLLTPTVTVGTSYTHFSDPFFNFGTGDISPSATSATLQASYSLLGWRKFVEIERARASLETAEASETATAYRVALATDAAYFAVLADHELSRVAAERLRRAQEQLGIARVRVQAGEAIATDSLQLLLEVNRARLAVLRGDSALAVSTLRLGRQIGLDGPAEAAPLDTTTAPALPLALDQAVTELRTQGPELVAARAAEQTTEAALDAERGGYLPELTLSATTGAYDAEFFPSALRRSQLAFTVSLPIWNGGQRELAIARARAQRNVAAAQRQDLERAAAEHMAEAYRGYETARAGTDLATVSVAVATESFRVQSVRYAEGATTILDLLEAQISLSEAEASLVQARHATRLALARIETLLGRRLFDAPGS
jgi:outer membrane protein TolC